MNYPVCPYCNQCMVRSHEHDDEEGWRVIWTCSCQPDPEIVSRMEQRMDTLQRTGTKITIRRTKQWVRS